MNFLNFSDHLIPYDVFLEDIAARVAHVLKSDSNDPEYISQRKAFEMFGRKRVEKWRRQGKVEPRRFKGVLEYRTADLRLLQRTQQE